jgi:uncharacterized protein
MRILNAVVLATVLSVPMTVAAYAESAAIISVTGEGQVAANPDMATITLGVTTTGATAAEAMTANSAELAKVLANLTSTGIEAKDIQTTGLSLNPNWVSDSSGESATINGYTATNMVNVRVRVLDGLGGVLDAAIKDGANTLNGMSFGVANPQPLNDEARKLAVADANRRATLLAEAAGVKLGRIQMISEATGYAQPSPMFRMDAAQASGAVPVQGGEISMTVTVNMTWEIAQ